MNSAKYGPNSWIISVGMSSDLEDFFVFNFLIIVVTLSVLTFWKEKVSLDAFNCSLITTMFDAPQILCLYYQYYQYLDHN